MDVIINENIKTKIYDIRGLKVMIDSDFSQRVQAQGQNFIKWKQSI